MKCIYSSNVDVPLSICPVVMIGICEIHESQRQTSENVFFINKTAHLPTDEPMNDATKVYKRIKITKKTEEKLY